MSGGGNPSACDIHPIEVVCRGGEPQLQVGEKLNIKY